MTRSNHQRGIQFLHQNPLVSIWTKNLNRPRWKKWLLSRSLDTILSWYQPLLFYGAFFIFLWEGDCHLRQPTVHEPQVDGELVSRFQTVCKRCGIQTLLMGLSSGHGWTLSMRSFQNQKRRERNVSTPIRPWSPQRRSPKLVRLLLTCPCWPSFLWKRVVHRRGQSYKGSTSWIWPTSTLSFKRMPSFWPILGNNRFLGFHLWHFLCWVNQWIHCEFNNCHGYTKWMFRAYRDRNM